MYVHFCVAALVFVAALFTVVKTWKQPMYPSVDEKIKKLWCVCMYMYMYVYMYMHTHDGILFSHEKEEDLTICHNMYVP